jgi:hypothetical protein
MSHKIPAGSKACGDFFIVLRATQAPAGGRGRPSTATTRPPDEASAPAFERLPARDMASNIGRISREIAFAGTARAAASRRSGGHRGRLDSRVTAKETLCILRTAS